MRILHLPLDLGAHPSGLACAQRQFGHEVIVSNLAWSPFGFHGDINHGLPFGVPWRLVRREVGRIALLVKSLLWADVIHAHFGQTLASVRPFPLPAEGRIGLVERLTCCLADVLWLRDVALWRRLGKIVAMTFYGDDLRPVAGAKERNPWSHLAIPEVAAPLAGRDSLKQRQVAALAAAGVKLFAVNPDLMEVLPPEALFLPYSHIDIGVIQFRESASDSFVRFVHMPSNRLVKGTQLFVDAISKLQDEGIPCSLTLVESQQHSAALEAIGHNDVLLDQLHVGWYGGVAVEAMAAGLPVVAHVLPRDRAWLPEAMNRELPVISANPANVTDVLRWIALMPSAERHALGLAGRRFVHRWHNQRAIAEQVLKSYSS